MTTHINIDEVIQDIYNSAHSSDWDSDTAKQQLYDLISNEIIGEDEEWKKEYPLSIKQDIKSRRNLRIEQRQKLEELFGRTN